jgi:NAD(P)H-dependent FMN reductase
VGFGDAARRRDHIPRHRCVGNAHRNHVAFQRWQKKVGESDAFIFTAAEYNRGPTAVLKNALDYAYAKWSNKPVAFVGYTGVGGARAVEQLRLHTIELQMAPIRTAVHILFPIAWP